LQKAASVTQDDFADLLDMGNDFDDEFDDDEFGDSAALIAAADAVEAQLSAIHSTQPKALKKKTYLRCIVLAVSKESITNQHGRTSDQLVLRLRRARSEEDMSRTTLRLYMRDDWTRTVVHPGTTVHLVEAQTMSDASFMIDNQTGFLIVHPDTLLSGTVVSDSITCSRRSVLASRIKAAGDRTPALLYGSMLHELFQRGLLHGFAPDRVQEFCREVVQMFVEDLWCLGETEQVAEQHLMEMAAGYRAWAAAFLGDVPDV
jgi:DNA replication ATP-dependent helicase Dna2